MRIDGCRTLLTGATGGLGQAMARALAARGARLVLTGRRAEVLEPLAHDLGAEALSVDLADRAAEARDERPLAGVALCAARRGRAARRLHGRPAPAVGRAPAVDPADDRRSDFLNRGT